jgi:tetratricopeptide (TPR) repeat protein
MAWQAIAAARHDPLVLDCAGLALALLAGENEAALAAMDRAIALNPNFALAFGHRALVLAFLNRPDEAILAAHQAMRLSPRDPGTFAFYQALTIAHLAAISTAAVKPCLVMPLQVADATFVLTFSGGTQQ